jgi:soluble lytic murein transglycosylase-like protein
MELEVACARSRRRARARRAAAARRQALSGHVLRTILLVVAFFGLLTETTQADKVRAKPMPKTAAVARTSCGIPREFAGAFRFASRKTGLSSSLLASVAWEESRMDPHAVSEAGARGLLQLLPGTQAVVAVAGSSPRANILAGARYLRLMVDRFQGELELALAAYNAGPTAVEQAGAAPTIETLRYAKNIEARAAILADCA